MFIREYAAVEKYSPLIVVDLPDRSFPVSDDQFSKADKQFNRRDGGCNPGLWHRFPFPDLRSEYHRYTFRGNEPQAMHCAYTSISLSRYRLHHAYRWKDRAVMRRFIMKIRAAGSIPQQDGSSRFLGKITQIYQESLVNPLFPVFSKQIR